jgi:hypothetical protein
VGSVADGVVVKINSAQRSFNAQNTQYQLSIFPLPIAFDLTVAKRICYKNMRVFVGFYSGDDAQNIPQ